jgi:ArsR family transcriptional regulator
VDQHRPNEFTVPSPSVPRPDGREDIDTCEYVRVSKSSCDPTDPLACCTPLTRAPMTSEQADQVSSLLKALGDPVRLRLMSLVLSHENAEACVCDLLPAFEQSQPTISHHLKVLHEAGLLDREKRGVWVYYQARPEALDALAGLFSTDAVAGRRAGAGA